MLNKIIEKLDAEFIYGRGRVISLRDRFPNLFCKDNIKNIYTIKNKKELISIIVIEPYSIGEFSGIKIGFVWTDIKFRLQGICKELMKQVIKQNGDKDFLVLWTKQPNIYGWAGFEIFDEGVVGSINKKNNEKNLEVFVTTNKSIIPLSALEVLEYKFCDNGRSCNVLVGHGEDKKYIYDSNGDYKLLLKIIKYMANNSNLLINCSKENSKVFGKEIEWKENKLTMFKIINNNFNPPNYINYLDRI